jgi:hypothetical protein
MTYPRENMDLLWELVKSAQDVGWHSAKLKDEPTTDSFIKSYERQMRALNKAYIKMEKSNVS